MASILDAVGVFLDDGVGQDFFGDALDFGAGRLWSEAAGQKYLPCRTLSIPSNRFLRSAFWIVCPWGSRTDVFNVT